MTFMEAEGLIIRNFISDDASDFFEILGDEETMRNCEPPYDFNKTKAFSESFCIGRHGAVAAVEKRSQKLIGYVLFNEFDTGVYEAG